MKGFSRNWSWPRYHEFFFTKLSGEEEAAHHRGEELKACDQTGRAQISAGPCTSPGPRFPCCNLPPRRKEVNARKCPHKCSNVSSSLLLLEAFYTLLLSWAEGTTHPLAYSDSRTQWVWETAVPRRGLMLLLKVTLLPRACWRWLCSPHLQPPFRSASLTYSLPHNQPIQQVKSAFYRKLSTTDASRFSARSLL